MFLRKVSGIQAVRLRYAASALASFCLAALGPAIPAQTATLADAHQASLKYAMNKQTIVTDNSQVGPNNTLTLRAHNALNPNIRFELICSRYVSGCSKLDDGEEVWASPLPAEDELAYKHYLTWRLHVLNDPLNDSDAIYAVFGVQSPQSNTLESGYLANAASSTFVEEGRYIDMTPLITQRQNKTDEQAVCLQFIERDLKFPRSPEEREHLPNPSVDCYDHITYTHVQLNNSDYGDNVRDMMWSRLIRGVIVQDNRPGSCGSDGCSEFLAIQGTPGRPGDEAQFRNIWSPGISTHGSGMKVGTSDHLGWYDIVVTRPGSFAASSGKVGDTPSTTYQYVGSGIYKSQDELAQEQKEAQQEEKRAQVDAKRPALDLYKSELQLIHGRRFRVPQTRSLVILQHILDQIPRSSLVVNMIPFYRALDGSDGSTTLQAVERLRALYIGKYYMLQGDVFKIQADRDYPHDGLYQFMVFGQVLFADNYYIPVNVDCASAERVPPYGVAAILGKITGFSMSKNRVGKTIIVPEVRVIAVAAPSSCCGDPDEIIINQ
jgi:hypothetical protein